jgi:RimJ/RimL family protein N-acetyltransferase
MDVTLHPLTLDGEDVRLEALALDHVDALCAAAAESRDTYALTNVPADRAGMARYVDTALMEASRGVSVPFATVDKRRGRVVGSTRFGNLERWSWPEPPPGQPPVAQSVGPSPFPDAVEIGWTWLAASAQRTHVNTEAKLLMLGHAFDVWHVRRVTLKTDERNARSRANIERIGGRLDGILRAHMPSYDGGVRSSAVYSILADEWPAARARLLTRRRERLR